jgi:hypothetical protein
VRYLLRFKLAAALFVLWVALRCALAMTDAPLGEARQLEIGAHRVSVLLFRGERPASTLLVVAHGGLASKETLTAVCWEARRRGADCVAVDALGHGGSSAQPSREVVVDMRRALDVARLIGPYPEVRFLGHSMGAFLGRGHPYPCAESVAVGNHTACDDQREVFGTVHRSLGLSDQWYLLSHVLEPWTPRVIEVALDHVLGKTADHRSQMTMQIALSWLSFAVMMALGVVVARALRAQGRPALAAAVVMWLALDIAAWRILWFMTPTQWSDGLVIGVVVSVVWLAAALLQRMGAKAPAWGVAVGVSVPLAAALALFVAFAHREFGGLLILLPTLGVPLAAVVVVWERLSRPKRGASLVEASLFVSVLLATFIALLLPSW